MLRLDLDIFDFGTAILRDLDLITLVKKKYVFKQNYRLGQVE